MKVLIISLFVLSLSEINSDFSVVDNTQSVHIEFTQTSSYCGGMAPTEEMMKRYRTPVAKSGLYYLKKGHVNTFDAEVLKVISATDGSIDLVLPPGDYLIVDEKKKDETIYKKHLEKGLNYSKYYHGFSEECLKEWFEKPDLTFTVADSSLSLKRNYHTPCFHQICATYTGPYPP